jgi:archaellum biogenesis protein FlaJ (TadC family)
MNRNTFIFSMVFEGFFAMAAIGLLFSDVGAIIYLYAAVVFAAVLTPFAIRLKKEQDETKKMKIRRNIALILLLPIVAGIAAIVLVVVALMLAL